MRLILQLIKAIKEGRYPPPIYCKKTSTPEGMMSSLQFNCLEDTTRIVYKNNKDKLIGVNVNELS